MTYSNLVLQWAIQFFAVSLMVFGAIGVAVGAGLVVSSQKTFLLFRAVNRWISTRHALKPVELPRDTDRIAHKYRKWIGIAFVVVGAISVFGLVARFDPSAVSVALAKSTGRPLVAWIAESVRWFLAIGSVFAVVVGGMLVLYPDAESTLERFANRWISSRRIFRGADEMHMTLDRLVEAHPAPFGWIVGCTSAAAVIYGLVMLVRY